MQPARDAAAVPPPGVLTFSPRTIGRLRVPTGGIDMNRMIRGLALAVAFSLAAPAFASTDDVKDTATETKAKAKRKARSVKPGHRTNDDRMADAKDSVSEGAAKTKKSVRKGARSVKNGVHDATK
jgi:hypothetical protein